MASPGRKIGLFGHLFGTAVRCEHAYQVGSDTDHLVLVVKSYGQAGGTTAEDMAMLMQPRGQCSTLLVRRDLFDPALLWDWGAIDVAPRVVGGSWSPG